MSCKRAQEYLAKAGYEIKEQIDARKIRLGAKEACELAQRVNHVYVNKGKRVTHFNMKKDPPDSETVAKLLLGPTGNPRAPALRKGKTLVVGFNTETYQQLFG